MANLAKWWAVLRRVWRGARDDDVTAVASSVAFFMLLAVFQGLAAAVSLAGTITDPSRIEALVSSYSSVLPDGSVDVVARQIERLERCAFNWTHSRRL